MYVYASLLIGIFALTAVHGDQNEYANNITDAIEKQHKVNKILKDVYATIEANIHENTRKLRLDDFSWGIFSGHKGRLQGFHDFDLVNNNTQAIAQKRKLDVSFEFTVPVLQAVWEKSVCLGYSCTMTIEIQDALFVLKMSFDAKECVIDHLAYLKKYGNAKSQASNGKYFPLSTGVIETTVKLLSQILNTRPFEKIVKDNVNHALLHLPIFTPNDIRRFCSAYQEI